MSLITVSIIKADVGGFPGHGGMHPDIKSRAQEYLRDNGSVLSDFHVAHVGDDLDLILLHDKGEDNTGVHKLCWDTFLACTEVARELRLYGAGQDLLSDSFSGNIKGLGPGVAELCFAPRKSEPITAFLMDKTEPGAFNLPFFKMFADPFNTAGLVIDPAMHDGFSFEIWDVEEHRKVVLHSPEELYDIIALLGAKSRYVLKRVFPNGGPLPKDEAVAAISTDKLSQIAGKYVGKDDPVGLVRAQAGLPAMGEVLEAFAFPQIVSGWMRGSHNGPLMPVGWEDAVCTRFDGPPRVTAYAFQVTPESLGRAADPFRDIAFDNARRTANDITDYLRRHGPFEPHRLPLQDMEYTTLPQVLEGLSSRFVSLPEAAAKGGAKASHKATPRAEKGH